MQEAVKRKRSRQKQSGQALLEYILLLFVALAFAQFLFFSPEYGIKGNVDKFMLKLGAHLETDLKSGAGPNGGSRGGAATPYSGIGQWTN